MYICVVCVYIDSFTRFASDNTLTHTHVFLNKYQFRVKMKHLEIFLMLVYFEIFIHISKRNPEKLLAYIMFLGYSC